MATERRTFVFGDFELDEGRRELRRRGDLVALHPTPFRLLQHLIHQRDRVVSRAELLEVVWPEAVVSDSALSSALKEIRHALGDDGKRQRWVRTMRGRGLRFVGDVEVGSAPPLASPPRIPQTAVTTFLCIEAADRPRSAASTDGEEAAPAWAAIEEQLKAAVARHAGDELRWSGDGRLVAFGDVADGVRCAIDLQQIARPAREHRQAGLRMGLHVGTASPRSPEEASFGTTAVLASRLCDAATEGEILASGAVAGLLAGRRAFRFEERGSRGFEGFAPSVPVFAMLYEADTIAPLRAQLRFVGRTAELDRLAQALDRARAGRGGLVLIAGEPGIGKTRLIEEFERSATRSGVKMLIGRCTEGEGERTYGPFADALAGLVDETDEARLRADLGPYGASLVPLVPQLRTRVPGLPDLRVLHGGNARVRLFDAVAALLLSAAAREPVLIVVDDLQWADRGTLALLQNLGQRARAGRLLLVGTYRSTEVEAGHPLAELIASDPGQPELDLIRLGGLDKESVRELLRSVAARDVPDAFAGSMTAQTSGNPFFIRELLIQMMVEGRLGREGRARSESLSVEVLSVPDSVRQVVGRRLGRLSERANRLLTVASGFHGEFSFPLASRVLVVDEPSALDALDEALEAGIVHSLRGDTYGFSHDVIRQTVLSVLNPSRRIRLHRRIAEEMEQAWGDAPARAGEIAWQYHRSRELTGAERGVRFCLVAADRAEQSAAPDETARFLRMARDLLPEGDDRCAQVLARLAFALAWSMAPPEWAVEAALEASDAVAAAEGHDAAAEILADLSALVRPQSKPPAWKLAAQGLRHAGERRDLTWARLAALDEERKEAADPDFPGISLDTPVRREIGRIVLAMPRVLAEAEAVYMNLPVHSRGQVLDRNELWLLGFVVGDLERARALSQHQAESALRDGRLFEAALALSYLATMEVALGDFDAAEEHSHAAFELSERVGDRTTFFLNAMEASVDRGFARDEKIEPGIPLGEAILRNRAPDHAYGRAVIQALLANAYARTGRDPESVLCAVRAVLPAIRQAPGWSQNYTQLVDLACEACWRVDRADFVEVLEPNLRSKILEPDFRRASTDARLSMARLAALSGRFDEATEWFSASRRVLDEQGARPLRAIADFEEALMYVRRDRSAHRERARALIDAALRQFEALAMPGWQRRAGELMSSIG